MLHNWSQVRFLVKKLDDICDSYESRKRVDWKLQLSFIYDDYYAKVNLILKIVFVLRQFAAVFVFLFSM